MLLSSTNKIDGYEITDNLGLVFGESVNGINFLKDIGAGLRNIVGGRSVGYENEIIKMREEVLNEMIQRASNLGADAIVGIKFDFSVMGQTGNMLMLNVMGTAVKIKK